MNHPEEKKFLGDGYWAPEYLQDIHGVFLITGPDDAKVEEVLEAILDRFGDTIIEATRANGTTRPGPVRAHEHFGYADGIAQPLIQGFPTTPHPGKDLVDQGHIFLGRKEDEKNGSDRADWALDGTFLVFRKLQQKVPEFNNFLEKYKLPTADTTKPDVKIGRLSAGAELLGARIVGRWKSGAPVEIDNLKDDPTKATRDDLLDDFRYNQEIGQTNCPFAAHTRKTNPRDDIPSTVPPPFRVENRRILRHGIQYGPELSYDERRDGKSSDHPDLERGLLFVCYQSSIEEGFRFIQHDWANNPDFLNRTKLPKDAPGHDALIGVDPKGRGEPRFFNDPAVGPSRLSLGTTEEDHWVVPRGGEYFFTPSISSLKTFFAKPPPSSHSEYENGTRGTRRNGHHGRA